jgi:hypothetical protein
MLAIAISFAGIALNNEAVNFQPSPLLILEMPSPISPNPTGIKIYCNPLDA